MGAPAALTAILTALPPPHNRDYVFLYLGVVAVLGMTLGVAPALVAAATSFLFVDWFLVLPLHTLSISDEQDLVNLVVFFSTAGLVGTLGSRRRDSQLRAEALARELHAANQSLERLNREQAEAATVAVRLARTEQQVRLLAESDRVRREFLATVSHELRTPLAAILTLSTAMAGRSDLPDDGRRDAARIAAQARRLNRLVGDMLDMARIEGNTLDLHLGPVDLGDAVESAVERLRHVAPEREVHVRVDSDLSVMADWDRLGQVLDNLLGNADHFAPPGTPIDVEATSGARDLVVLRVVDGGPGIPTEEREHVFERFVRGPAESEHAGTGLGLAIVRGLVEAQAGRVWVDDTDDGAGTCISVALPAAPEG